MVPSKEESAHFNFPELVIHNPATEGILSLLQQSMEGRTNTPIVLNFEKCRWFDILPLVQILAIVCRYGGQGRQLHVIGPCCDVLPYLHSYLAKLEKQFAEMGDAGDQVESMRRKIRRHREELPRARKLAGAFLVGWGFFDGLESNLGNCLWYAHRLGESISLAQLSRTYGFGYGSREPIPAEQSDRVWRFTAVGRNEKIEFMKRMNGADMIYGALSRYANIEAIHEGSVSNIVFFEPFENVFEHAFEETGDDDCAWVCIRVIDWKKKDALTPRGRWSLAIASEWYRNCVTSFASDSFMEIVVADDGLGIPRTIGDALKEDQEYWRHNTVEGSFDISVSNFGWHSIRYAFRPYSSRRRESRLGRRGLSWLKETLDALQGGVEVHSNGAVYGVYHDGKALVEMPPSSSAQAIHGTFMRILLPLVRMPKTKLRAPHWAGARRDDLTLPFRTGVEATIQRVFELRDESTDTAGWASCLSSLIEGVPEGSLCALDFDGAFISRAVLECFFNAFIQLSSLHGRTILLNVHPHVASRLVTVEALRKLGELNLVIPAFDLGLNLYWAGASSEREDALLESFRSGTRLPSEMRETVNANPGFFERGGGAGAVFRFDFRDVEEITRRALGQKLAATLEQRGAILRGAYALPHSVSVPVYIEPHQLFGDADLAQRLCNHLANMIRWWYARDAGPNFRVLTTTRIGREIALRMPFTQQPGRFVYQDHDLLRQDKPGRLQNLLAGQNVAIVVDIISTGGQVQSLITACVDAGGSPVGVLSFIDASEGSSLAPKSFATPENRQLPHRTFWRYPQRFLKPGPSDTSVDAATLSITPVLSHVVKDESASTWFSRDDGLRFLEDCRAIHHGHFELFGHHYDFVVNLQRLLVFDSPHREALLRACEQQIVRSASAVPVGVVIYPDTGTAHLLHAALERRPTIRWEERRDKLTFVEARRAVRPRGMNYWLTRREVEDLRKRLSEKYPSGFAALILDDGASSGETLLALLDLCRTIRPKEVSAFVLIDRMPHLLSRLHADIGAFKWAKSGFGSLLRLDIPVYTAENCPQCREHATLEREARLAQNDWFANQLRDRLRQLDLITTLGPQDQPESIGFAAPRGPRRYPWEDRSYLPGSGVSPISEAARLRVAIHEGVLLSDILKELEQPCDDFVFASTVGEVARRVGQLRSQKLEDSTRTWLVRHSCRLTHRTQVNSSEEVEESFEVPRARRIAVLEALRYLRPESVVFDLPFIVRKAIEVDGLVDDVAAAELLLLLKRVLQYRHLPASSKSIEMAIAGELRSRADERAPRSVERQAIERFLAEFTNVRVGHQVRRLLTEIEGILRTNKKQHHRYGLRATVGVRLAHRLEGLPFDITNALNQAVELTRLVESLIPALQSGEMLVNQDLVSLARGSVEKALRLREEATAFFLHQREIDTVGLRERLDDVDELLCRFLPQEIGKHIFDVVKAVHDMLHTEWRGRVGLDQGVRVDFVNSVGQNVPIVFSAWLAQELLNNMLTNLRHARTNLRPLQATLSLVPGVQANTVAVTMTCPAVNVPGPAEQGSTSAQIETKAAIYDATHEVSAHEPNVHGGEERIERWIFYSV